MITTKEVPIKYKKLRCAKCLRCYTSCPFEAISLKNGKIEIDAEKCQLCGICASICPADNIELICYGDKWLIDYVKHQKENFQNENLVVMCRGSSPLSCHILETLKEQKVEKFIPLRLPCVGRVTMNFYLKALNIGIKKIIVVQCDDVSCRFNRGSIFSSKKFQRLQELLKEVEYESDAVTLIENPLKAVYETKDCVGCDKCEFICPYDAIVAQPLATPVIDYEKCIGCGACALVCPHLAIQLEGFGYDSSTLAIQKYKEQIKSKNSNSISPSILVFCCKWAEFSALDDAKKGILKENVAVVEIPCINGLDPAQVINAFNSGFDGVLAVVCPEDDCRSKEGRNIAENNISVLEKVLKSKNITNRFEIITNSPREIGEFDSKLESFIKKINSLPEIDLEEED